MTIEEYIKSKEKFHLMPFVTIYTAIMELIDDGYIEQTAFEKAGGSESPDVHDFHRKGTRPINQRSRGRNPLAFLRSSIYNFFRIFLK